MHPTHMICRHNLCHLRVIVTQDDEQQERKDAKWWLGGDGKATLNGARGRDVERFWAKASSNHEDVVGNLRDVSCLTQQM